MARMIPPAYPAAPAARSLFSPLQLGELSLQHRIVLTGTPDGPSGSWGADPFARLERHYVERCTPGGLIICGIDAAGASPPSTGLGSAVQVNAWRRITDAVHAAGALAMARIGDGASTPVGLPDLDGVDDALETYRTTAENAGDAGFDGVELLCTRGTLAERFLSQSPTGPGSSGHGSGADCGEQFIAEALRSLISTWSPARVGICLEAAAAVDGGIANRVWPTLTELGVAAVHVCDAGVTDDPRVPFARLRRAFGGALIVGAAWTAESAGAAIAQGQADAVSPHAFVGQADLARCWGR